jgi:hypothetical protein
MKHNESFTFSNFTVQGAGKCSAGQRSTDFTEQDRPSLQCSHRTRQMDFILSQLNPLVVRWSRRMLQMWEHMNPVVVTWSRSMFQMWECESACGNMEQKYVANVGTHESGCGNVEQTYVPNVGM